MKKAVKYLKPLYCVGQEHYRTDIDVNGDVHEMYLMSKNDLIDLGDSEIKKAFGAVENYKGAIFEKKQF